MICSLPPTSAPSMKSRSQMSHVVAREVHVPTASLHAEEATRVRIRYPMMMPEKMNAITLNIFPYYIYAREGQL